MMHDLRLLGAVEAFDTLRFGGPTRFNEGTVVIAQIPKRLLNPNPDRLMFIIQNNGNNTVTWSTVGTLAAGGAFNIAAGQQLIAQVQNDGVLCAVELYGISSVGNNSCQIFELIRQRSGR